MSNEPTASVPPRRAAAVKAGTRALLVDNSLAAIEPIHQCLAAIGCAATMLHDGAQGLVAARRDAYDLAVLDVALPEVDGYQLCRELKRLERPPLVVMLTARAEPEDRFWAAECGADLFVAKPVDPEVFALRLADLLGGR